MFPGQIHINCKLRLGASWLKGERYPPQAACLNYGEMRLHSRWTQLEVIIGFLVRTEYDFVPPDNARRSIARGYGPTNALHL